MYAGAHGDRIDSIVSVAVEAFIELMEGIGMKIDREGKAVREMERIVRKKLAENALPKETIEPALPERIPVHPSKRFPIDPDGIDSWLPKSRRPRIRW